jgi:hypothetical protein
VAEDVAVFPVLQDMAEQIEVAWTRPGHLSLAHTSFIQAILDAAACGGAGSVGTFTS